jgi:hypothetical protein
VRVLRLIRGQEARMAVSAAGDRMLIDAGEMGTASIRRTELAHGLRQRLIEPAGQDMIRATAEGRALARRAAAGADPYAAQHQERVEKELPGPGTGQRATINLSESPLSQLARRLDRNGRPFLSETECAAGERLRDDYDRARIMPRLGINWDAPIAGTGRIGPGSESQSLTDSALAARARVEDALQAVGPDLAGVLVDICCFLKGLAQVEAERGWPVRSAKLMLKTALSALDRHYRPSTGGCRRVLHWGVADYRPTTVGRGRS